MSSVRQPGSRARGLAAALVGVSLLLLPASRALADSSGGGRPLSSAAARAAGARVAATRKPRVFCYVETLFGGVDPGGLDLSVCTDVVEAFLLADPSGAIHPANGLPRRALIDAARRRGSRVLVAVGGATVPAETFTSIASRPEALQRFAEELSRFAVDSGYDGVDLDWEFPTASERGLLVAAVGAIRARLASAFAAARRAAPPLVLLGVTPGARLESYDFAALAPRVDYFVQFGYDFRNPALGPWANSAPFWPDGATQPIEGSVRSVAGQLLARGVPREKLIISLPLYASDSRPWIALRAKALASRAAPDPRYLETEIDGAWVTGPAAMEEKVRRITAGNEIAGGAAAGVALWQLGHQGPSHDLTDAVARGLAGAARAQAPRLAR